MAWLLLACTTLLVCLVALVAHYCRECSVEGGDYTRRWFLGWLWRGALGPILVWVLMNLGTMPLMPPLIKYVGRMRAYGNFGVALEMQTILAALAIVSCWAALTFIWFLADLFRRARNQDDLIIAGIVWSPVMLPVFWAFGHFAGWAGIGFATVLWVWPLAQYSVTVAEVRKPAPSYSRAIGKIKFGKYGEAELAIIGELEKCESDFAGWMMLADLYAHQFKDLGEAEKTIYDLCAEPSTTLSQISIALHRLADWELELGGNPVAARRVLEEICARMPGTHLAMMARQRINQLPGSREELAEQRTPQKVAMPALNDTLDEAAGPGGAPVNAEAALAASNQLVAKLNQDPNDTGSREKLAKIFAEQLGQLDLAMEQLELLVGMPGQPAGKLAEWLALMAAWQIKQRGEGEAARKILERLIREFPHSAQAFAAQRRLSLMNMNAKMRQGAKTVGGKG